MRLLSVLLALAVVALAVPAQAQPPTFSEPYQLRGAVGDIPTTNATEPAGAWNLEQRLTVQFDNASQAQYPFNLPAGARLLNATCTCNPSQSTATSDSVVFTLPTSTPSGSYVLTVLTTQAAGQSFGFSIHLPIAVAASERVAILYVPTGLEAEAAAGPTRSLPSTNGQSTIVQFDDLPSPFWASVHPDDGTATVAQDSGIPTLAWVFLAVGLVAGAVVWAVLVSRGAVQTKSRKQVANTAAHVEAAAAEPPAVLEGRKRALLAALKEIEVARMNSEMPQEVYDVVKADLKRQAVTVMRALETAGAAADAKA